MVFYIDADYQVVGAGGVPYTVRIQIPQATWDLCSADVQTGVTNILATQPISILSASGTGNGIKIEPKGLEFHTQTDKRLCCDSYRLSGGATWLFDRYRKGSGHKARSRARTSDGALRVVGTLHVRELTVRG